LPVATETQRLRGSTPQSAWATITRGRRRAACSRAQSITVRPHLENLKKSFERMFAFSREAWYGARSDFPSVHRPRDWR
jgi:hypothetical protein